MAKKHHQKKKPLPQGLLLFIAFIVPVLVFNLIFIATRKESLVADLGMQYIDFLAFFKRSLFHPSRFIYSFQNELGGSMLGTTAYYLMSPLNLLLVLCPQRWLAVGIQILISIKLGLISMSGYYAWSQKYKRYVMPMALSYALCGYTAGNWFNIMWLDSLYLLPLLLLSIDHLIAGKKNHLILWTALLAITNFYTGWMSLLFGLLYYITGLNYKTIKQYVYKSLTGGLISAVVLIPAVSDLLLGKTTDHHAAFSWGLMFKPYDFLSTQLILNYTSKVLAKTSIPSLYLGALVLTFGLSYFINRKINYKKRIADGMLLLFMLISCIWTPLVLVWHLGQFPIWYPARFSFVINWLMIDLALKNLNAKPDKRVKITVLIIWSVLITLIIIYAPKITLDTKAKPITVSALIGITALIGLITIANVNELKIASWIQVLDIAINFVLVVANMGGLNLGEYQNFVDHLPKIHDTYLTRTGRGFVRSSNESFSGGFNSDTVFNSIYNNQTTQFQRALGYVSLSTGHIANFGQTEFAKSFLSESRYLAKNPGSFENWHLNLKSKPLPMVFKVYNDPILINNPLVSQTHIAQALGQKILYTPGSIKKVGHNVFKVKADYLLMNKLSYKDKIYINNSKINRNVKTFRYETLQAVLIKMPYKTQIVRIVTKRHINLKAVKGGILHVDKLHTPNVLLKQNGLTVASNGFKANGTMATTIPYSRNWRVYDNGKQLKVTRWGHAMLSFKLTSGTHKLTFKYVPTEFYLGALISLLGLIMALLPKWLVIYEKSRGTEKSITIRKGAE